MKRYPYSDSTDMIIYNQPEKKKRKKRKPGMWTVAVSSALAASIFTVAIYSTTDYIRE